MSGEISKNLTELHVNEIHDEDIVDPWNVVSKCDTGVDYDKLISEFFIIVFSLQLNMYGSKRTLN